MPTMAVTPGAKIQRRRGVPQQLYRGWRAARRGQGDRGKEHLERAYQLQPEEREGAEPARAGVLQARGLFDRAAEIYEMLVRDNPVDPTLRVNLGLVYLKTNQLTRAVREFETAVDLQPGHQKAHNYLGLALAQAGEYGRAREHFVDRRPRGDGGEDGQGAGRRGASGAGAAASAAAGRGEDVRAHPGAPGGVDVRARRQAGRACRAHPAHRGGPAPAPAPPVASAPLPTVRERRAGGGAAVPAAGCPGVCPAPVAAGPAQRRQGRAVARVGASHRADDPRGEAPRRREPDLHRDARGGAGGGPGRGAGAHRRAARVDGPHRGEGRVQAFPRARHRQAVRLGSGADAPAGGYRHGMARGDGADLPRRRPRGRERLPPRGLGVRLRGAGDVRERPGSERGGSGPGPGAPERGGAGTARAARARCAPPRCGTTRR